jgi:ribosomal protein S18 acetylase RimI-like enzyme
VWLEGEDCELEDIYVSEAARGAGLGRALVGLAIERARARGCGRIQLDVRETNEAGIALYRAAGFRIPEPGEHDVIATLRLSTP